MTSTNDVVAEFRQIKAEYQFNPDIMNDEDERVSRVKEIITKNLSQVDRTIFLLYVDCQSLRELGKKLGLSHMTCSKEIRRIKAIILNEYNKSNDIH